ncbi:MAG: hypothetical protein ACI9C1_000514 [Candidatus Aldehydirespiratoraceae bacterium]|jgi:hypothetical protein
MAHVVDDLRVFDKRGDPESVTIKATTLANAAAANMLSP